MKTTLWLALALVTNSVLTALAATDGGTLPAANVNSPVFVTPTAAIVPAIVPLPVKMQVTAGVFPLTTDTVIVADAASTVTAQQLAAALAPATGFTLKVTTRADTANSSITLKEDAGLASLGKEGYQLLVTPQAIQLSAAGQAGLFYGVQTLRQLFPPQIFAVTPVTDVAWSVPCVTIEDTPRFAWRGLMLDSGHDFQNKAFVLRFIELMALHKLNLFHWHLTDLGTWSLEIKGRPKLLEAFTRGPGVKPGYYTQDEIREVVRYAAERHITILPEIDMPGHETPALLAYPELDCPLSRGAKRPWEFCVGNEQTFAFLEEVLSQVVELFPGSYIHIGGDECPKGRWLKCPLCQSRMQKEKLQNGEELQSYFIKRIGKFLASKNRRMIGWDEILEGGLAPSATVMSWRSMAGGIEAAKTGHDTVMAPKGWLYFDYPNVSVYQVYGFEPIPKELTAAQAVHVLGAQAQMWTDSHPSENAIDAMVYPRAAALAEVVWSPAASRDYDAFMVRLPAHVQRLAALGVKYKPLTTGVVVGSWEKSAILAKPTPLEWPVTKGLNGPGKYHVKIQTERGLQLQVQTVEIVQGGKVLATSPAAAAKGNSAYCLELPDFSGGPLTLRVTAITQIIKNNNRRNSSGIVYLEKML